MERALLQSLVDFLSYRGPDSRELLDGWFDRLGHAMCGPRANRWANASLQVSMGGFGYADARLDGRAIHRRAATLWPRGSAKRSRF